MHRDGRVHSSSDRAAGVVIARCFEPTASSTAASLTGRAIHMTKHFSSEVQLQTDLTCDACGCCSLAVNWSRFIAALAETNLGPRFERR